MINDVVNISVGGVGGVKVRQLDYTASTVNSPGELLAEFVSENNVLIEPGLSYLAPSLISIGNIKLKMFPISWNRRRSANGENTLEVRYSDESFILDQYFVGLKSKHHEYSGVKNFKFNGRVKGFANYNSFQDTPVGSIPNNFIILGSYIDPCKDKTFQRQTKKDPCSPCPSTFSDGDIDCQKLRSESILDVNYGFGDLIAGIRSKKIKVILQTNYNSLYKAAYVGTLRSVLQSWCSDFGFSYVYNSFGGAGEIIIYDLSSGIRINNKGLMSSCKTISFSSGKSLEHTTSNGIIAHYATPGGAKEIPCDSSFGGRITLRPLTLRDLVAQQEWEYQDGGPLYGTTALKQNNVPAFEVLEMVSLLSAYSKELRDAVVWFDLYNLKTASEAKKCAQTTTTVNGVNGLPMKRGGYLSTNYGDDLNNKHTLPLLKTTIKAVFDSNSETYKSIVNASGKDFSDLLESKRKEITSIGGEWKPYFFIASLPKAGADIANRREDWESEIGKNFLGKYFIRKYDSVIINPPTFTAAGSDQVQFYKQGTKNLEFAQLFPYNIDNNNSYIDELYDSGKITDSFLLVTRTPVPAPPFGGVSEYEQLINKASAFLPIKIDSVNSLKEKIGIQIENPHSYFNGKPALDRKTWFAEDYLFLGIELPNGLHTQKPETGTHPLEKKFETQIEGFTQKVLLGLKDVHAQYFSVGGKYFWFPPQSTVREAETGPGSAGYYIYYRNNFSSNTTIFYPKSELVVSSVNNSSGVSKININFKEFDNESIDDFKLNSDSNCLPNESEIKKAMQNYVDNMASLHNTEHETQSFEVDGLPEDTYGVLDGLQSLKIRISSDGVRSYLDFSDFKDNLIERSEAFKEYELKYYSQFLAQNANRQYVQIPSLRDSQQIPTL